MNTNFTIFFLCLFSFNLIAQTNDIHSLQISRVDEMPFDLALAPFYHGVASGDPLSDGVIIWTRVTPENLSEDIEIMYFVSTDPNMEDQIQSGSIVTGPIRDFTVKVDLSNLEPDETYYYRFEHEGISSLIGRTKTAPIGEEHHVRFGVVSCSNYQAGYFNAYARLAERADLDLIIHLGDYIYEYGGGTGTYGFDSTRLERVNVPGHEILEVADYRTRHSLYKLDPDLRAAHQQHPFVAIWDDHEFANDAYQDGAENHNEDEGSWEERKAKAKQVYNEWMPIREGNTDPLYRTIRYGDLVDLIMLDTRVEGREKQLESVEDSDLYLEDRTMLGQVQKDWFFNEMSSSDAQWKVIGNQVIFSEFHVGWAGALIGSEYNEVESIFLDIWDGYPYERNQIIDYISDNDIDNTVILTGDFHSTFLMDVAKFPSQMSLRDPLNVNQEVLYDPVTKEGSVAVEFAAPSITSANFDENVNEIVAMILQNQSNAPLSDTHSEYPSVIPNPNLRYVDLIQHGYYVLDITPEKSQADYYFVDKLDAQNEDEIIGANFYSMTGLNYLIEADGPASEKENPPALAPTEPFDVTGVDDVSDFVVFNIFPNPIGPERIIYMELGLLESKSLKFNLYSVDGTKLESSNIIDFNSGHWTQSFKLSPNLTAGIYWFSITDGKHNFVKKLIVN